MTNERWTREEEQFLIDRYTDFTNAELANILNRTYYSIRAKAKEYNLSKAEKVKVESRAKEKKAVLTPQPKPKFKSYYEPTSIRKINEIYGLRIQTNIG